MMASKTLDRVGMGVMGRKDFEREWSFFGFGIAMRFAILREEGNSPCEKESLKRWRRDFLRD